MYSENCKILMKWIEDDTKKWKDPPSSWIGRVIIVKMTIFLKEMYSFNVISIKIPMVFLIQLEKIILKFVWNHRRSQIAKAISKKNKAGRTPWVQMIIQSYSNQNSMVLAQKQTHGSMV